MKKEIKIEDNQLKEELIKLRQQFFKTLETLHTASDKDLDTIAIKYPFKKSFETVTINVSDWIEEITDLFNDKKGNKTQQR